MTNTTADGPEWDIDIDMDAMLKAYGAVDDRKEWAYHQYGGRMAMADCVDDVIRAETELSLDLMEQPQEGPVL